MSTPTKLVSAAAHPHPGANAGGGSGLGELGRTTSSRDWLALVAMLLVIVAFTVWGLFGTIPVQTTTQATVTNGGFPLQITAGVEGSVASITTNINVNSVAFAAGAELMTIQPTSGGKPVVIKTPVEMVVSIDIIQGSPVTVSTVVAHGAPIANAGTDNGQAQVYAFLGIDVVESLKSAESMTVRPTSPSLASNPAPIQVTHVGAVPVSQEQIVLLSGNTIYAQQAYSSAGGAPYAVLFKYLNASDAEQVTGVAAAEITVTQSTLNPLSLLFSS